MFVPNVHIISIIDEMQILHTIHGTVLEGKKRGKTLGFPTVNVGLTEKVPEGIYASMVIIDDRKFLAASFVGTPKTFKEDDYKAESYILDFDEDIYNKEVTIELYKKLRDNQTFNSPEELVDQIKEDVLQTREFFEERVR